MLQGVSCDGVVELNVGTASVAQPHTCATRDNPVDHGSLAASRLQLALRTQRGTKEKRRGKERKENKLLGRFTSGTVPFASVV